MSVGKSTPGIIVDGAPVFIIPNSVEIDKGYGEVNVRSVSLGGGVTTSVHTENVENNVGMVKFKLPATDLSIALIDFWKIEMNVHTVSAIDKRGLPLNLLFASMTNKPVIPLTADGVIEVEFKGDSI